MAQQRRSERLVAVLGMERAVAGAHLQLVSVRHPKVGRQAAGVELEVTGDAVEPVLVEREPLLHAVRHLGRLEQRTEHQREEKDGRGGV